MSLRKTCVSDSETHRLAKQVSKSSEKYNDFCFKQIINHMVAIKKNYKLTVFVGDTDSSLSIAAKAHDLNAFLLNSKNLSYVFDNLDKDSTVYTSLGDLPKDISVLYKICSIATDVFYVPPKVWSDKRSLESNSSDLDCIQSLTEHILLLSLLNANANIHGLKIKNLEHPVPLVDLRKSNKQQLWIAGDSISHGLGVEKHQRYGQLLADSLGLESNFLTRPASAIDWASDQILRSDIRENDIVIFGITFPQRITYVYNNRLLSITPNTSYPFDPKINAIVSENMLLNENTFYNHQLSIERAINFCNKINAKLLLIGLMNDINLLRYLYNKKNFFNYPHEFTKSCSRKFVDYGADNHHPGVIQHQLYKDFILQKLNS